MFVRKNRYAPELSAASYYAKLSHSKQLLKNIHPVMLAHFCTLTKKRYLQYWRWKPQRIANCTQLQQPSRNTSRQNTCDYSQRLDSHWRHQSASHKWPRKHQFDTCWLRSQGTRAVVVTWSFCQPYVRSPASSSFCRTAPDARDVSGNQLSYS